MAFGPPSYQAAAYRQLWPIIAPYVIIEDLYAACLVCRQWNTIFTPLLWGNPARLFGTDSDTVYLSLTKFKRRLSRVRYEIRSLVHTLHIPPAQPELYDGPQAGWFRDILDRLPSLQALVVSNLSFFDHQSLQTIHQSEDQTEYPLRLLVASKCENTTPLSLSTAIFHFPDLMYLDLSAAHGSRNPYVLQQIGTLSQLRVLKLQNCGLRDDDLDYLTFPSRLRSLDVSRNFLTERGVSNIIQRLPAAYMPHRQSIIARRYSGVPLPLRVLDEGIESFVSKRLTSGVDGFLQIEEGVPQNFSHLYLSKNNFTVDALTKLENYPSLQHLDCGSLNLSQSPIELLSPQSPTRRFSDPPPDNEILSPVLFCNAFRNLRSLRIHHSVVTSCPFSGTEVNTISEQCFELPSEDLRFELDSTELATPGTFFELEDTSSGVRYELPEGEPPAEPPEETHATFETPDDVGKDITPPTSPIISSDAPHSPVSPMSLTFPKFPTTTPIDIILHSAPSAENHGSHNILRKPVPLHLSVSESTSPAPEDQSSKPSTSAPLGPEAFTYKYHQGPEKPWRETLPVRQKAVTIKELIDEITLRHSRLEAREREPGRFKPSMLPNLKRLILTDIPNITRDKRIINNLTMFIQENAEEEELARLEYLRLFQNENSIPDWKGVGEEKITGTLRLHQLMLEITITSPEQLNNNHDNHQRRGSYNSKRLSFSKSTTEDPDSEMFMHATERDFSFFGEDDGGLLVSEGRIDGIKQVDLEGGLIREEAQDRKWDVVRELACFRRERKGAFERGGREGSMVGGVEMAGLGHWRGSIKVVKEVDGGW